jgi:hypothetical protein
MLPESPPGNRCGLRPFGAIPGVAREWLSFVDSAERNCHAAVTSTLRKSTIIADRMRCSHRADAAAFPLSLYCAADFANRRLSLSGNLLSQTFGAQRVAVADWAAVLS